MKQENYNNIIEIIEFDKDGNFKNTHLFYTNATEDELTTENGLSMPFYSWLKYYESDLFNSISLNTCSIRLINPETDIKVVKLPEEIKLPKGVTVEKAK